VSENDLINSVDLFAQAIQMSGSALSNWVHGSRVADETRKLAIALCPAHLNPTSEQVKSCLMSFEPDELQRKQVEIVNKNFQTKKVFN
jgi:hypothetical protein